MKSFILRAQVLSLVMLILVGCGDFQILVQYETSPIVDKIKDGSYEDGDFLSNEKICIILPGSPPNSHRSIKENWDISEVFFFIVHDTESQDEVAKKIHESWIERGFDESFCETENQKIIVRKPTRERVRIELTETN